MRRFQVSVNGNTYEVEVEELGDAAKPMAAAPVAVQAAPKAKPVVAAPVAAGSTKVVAPMPGKIVDVKVSVGQSVKEGDLVAILEAMKMENEVFAPSAGTVASVNVTASTAVETNDVIITLN